MAAEHPVASPHLWKFHVDYHDVVWAVDEVDARAMAVDSLREEDGTLLRIRKCIEQNAEEDE